MTHLRADVLIIGAGAAGATLAATLAERGFGRIILVEKGPHYGAAFFNQRELDMSVLRAESGRRTTADGAYPVQSGECVGGGTTVNFALSFDPVESVWRRWRDEHGVTGFSFDAAAADYGVPGLNLASAVADVRKRINVAPVAAGAVNENNRLFKAGADALGIPVRTFELNMDGCIGCGFCGQGCAYDAKRGTLVTYVPDALSRGVMLVHHCDIDALTLADGPQGPQAKGATGTVRANVPGSKPNSVPAGPISIDARIVIVASGAVGTPVLLQRSHVPDPQDAIGRGVVLHPSLPVGGIFERIVDAHHGITGAYYSDAFRDEHGFVIECLFDQPVDTALAVPGVGAQHWSVMRQYRSLGGFGVMLIDTADPDNRVVWDADAQKPSVRYTLPAADIARVKFGAKTALRIMFAAGAREAFLTSDERPAGERAFFRNAADAERVEAMTFDPQLTLLASAHVQASVKMSGDSRPGVVNSRGEVRGVRNLLVCDASVFPTSCGANPMIAIMAMARYQGLRIAAEGARYA
jgi:choline dehydrogenase-like flavoprotein